MRVIGKIIGAILGFALTGHPFGAVLGMAIGHAYDMRSADSMSLWSIFGATRPRYRPSSQQAIFMNGVIVLGAKMAKADGRVTRAKIDAFKRAFRVRLQDEAYVGRMFDQARSSAEGFEPYAFNLAQTFFGYPVILEEILSGLFLIANAENGVSIAEADFLRKVAFTFNFSPEDFYRIAARTGVRLPSEKETREARREARRDRASDPFAILGINANATNEAVKTAYRTLIRKHHPDKLIAEGLPPEFIATANEKMKRINVAYEEVCNMRGIK